MKLRSALFTLLLATQVAVAAKPVEFIHATKDDIHSADPGALYEVTTDRFLSNIYEAFVMRDNDLKLIPALAVCAWHQLSLPGRARMCTTSRSRGFTTTLWALQECWCITTRVHQGQPRSGHADLRALRRT